MLGGENFVNFGSYLGAYMGMELLGKSGPELCGKSGLSGWLWPEAVVLAPSVHV